MPIIKRAVCVECDKQFEVYDPRAANQVHCPQCIAAKNDHINSIPLERDGIFHDIVTIKSLPAEWRLMQPKRPHDNQYWKIDVSGRDLFDGWSDERPIGRIIINGVRPFSPGEVVRCRIVRTLHDTKDGNQEVREYMALSPAPDNMYPAWTLEWSEVDEVEIPPADLGWCEIDGKWGKCAYGGGRGGVLGLLPLADEVGFDECDFGDYDEVLLGESILAKLREEEE